MKHLIFKAYSTSAFRRFLLLSGSIMLLLGTSACHNTNFISPSHGNIAYIGRFDKQSDEAFRFAWPGTAIRFRVQGEGASLHLNGGDRNYFNLFIDEKFHSVIHSPGDSIIKIPGIEDTNPHTVTLQKRTEGEMGTAVFKGISLSSSKLLPDTSDQKHKIEFLGNSITCGYGSEGASRSEPFKPETENVNKSFASIAARAFQATPSIIAHSGLGLVRNYGDSLKVSVSRKPMPARFNRTLDLDPEPLWNFSAWQPDLMVINLGTNDYSTKPHPNPEIFSTTYMELLHRIGEAYPETAIIAMSGPLIDEPASMHIEKAVEEYKKQTAKEEVYFLKVPNDLLDRDSDYGSDAHPSYRGQKKIASVLIPFISEIKNWEYNQDEIAL